MKLLIDAGNTRIKWALVDDDHWLRNGTLPVAQAGDLPGLFADSQELQQIWVSNVAGEEVAQHVRNAGARWSVPIHFVVAQETQFGVRNGYTNPAQLGSDRWAALIAAWNLVHGKCLVVNSGTAITIDALSANGEFLGGLILPGLEVMQRSLAASTAQLKAVHREPEKGKFAYFPENTADAMWSGAMQAACGAIQRQHALLEDDDAPVVLSGGAAAVLAENINLPLRIEDNLVLQGLLLISRGSNK